MGFAWIDKASRQRVVRTLRNQAARVRRLSTIRKAKPEGISLKQLTRVFPVKDGLSPDSPRRQEVISVEEWMRRKEAGQVMKDKARMQRQPGTMPPAVRRR